MTGTRIVVDGLWRCLCPGVDAAALRRAIGSPFAPRTLASSQRPRNPTATSRTVRLPQNSRTLHSTNRLWHGNSQNAEKEGQPAFDARIRAIAAAPTAPDAAASTVDALLKAKPPYHQLSFCSASVIYGALEKLRKQGRDFDKIHAFVRFLLEARQEKPNEFIYETLMLAQAHTKGSAGTVKSLVREMRECGITCSPELYHSALRALAIHPDYLVRNSILAEMKEKWIDLSLEDKLSVAIGLIRDGQQELAFDQLEAMIGDGDAIPPWLFDVFVYSLGQAGFLEEALKIVDYRVRKGDTQIALNLWYFLLDMCSRELHYEGTRYTWNRTIQPGLLNASDGISLNVLNTASRHRDAKLATEAIQHISARGTRLGMHHYEALVDCYAESEDVENALQVLCVMHSAGVRCDGGTTRSIFRLLKRLPGLNGPAVKALSDLRAQQDIPLPAFNVVLEAILESGDVDRALDLYQHVRQLCSSGPDITTFNTLTKKCERPDIASFLLSEMAAFSIKPDAAIYDRLLYILADQGELGEVFEHLQELTGVNPSAVGKSPTPNRWVSDATALVLLRRCFLEDDARAQAMVDICTARATHLEHQIREMVRDVESKRAARSRDEPSTVTADTNTRDTPVSASGAMLG